MARSVQVFLFLSICLNLVHGIKLTNGRYSDIYIVIKDTVPESQALIDRIKVAFTEGSQKMFEATHNRVYFGDITVIIPKTWTKKDEYEVTPVSVLGQHITVETSRIKAPHVLGLNKCGQGGKTMNLSPEFLMDTFQLNYGPHKNVIVHEWGHLRWGLFDEYKGKADPKSNDRFYLDGGRWEPVRCTKNVEVSVIYNRQHVHGEPCDVTNIRHVLHQNCTYQANVNQAVDASFMGSAYIRKLNAFCDKDDSSVNENLRHNSKASSIHNIYCHHKSAWEVMRMHKDFKEDARVSLPASTDTTPNFRLIHEKAKYRVLVLDTSSSMDGARLDKLNQVSRFIIQDLIQLNQLLSVVWFSTTSSVRIGLTNITSDADRQLLISKLPTSASGSTCIGCGIDSAIAVLRSRLGKPDKGEIIVVSDGENNVGSLATSVQDAVAANVIIHTVSVSQSAEQTLQSISRQTGGKSFFWSETGSISLAAVFTEIFSSGASTDSDNVVTILSESLPTPLKAASFSFIVDEGTGLSTKIAAFTDSYADIGLVVQGPGEFYQSQVVNADSSLTLAMNGTALAGRYNVKIKLSDQRRLEYYVTSYPSNAAKLVQLSTRLSADDVNLAVDELPALYADLSRERVPVAGAEVTAFVEIRSKNCTLTLSDDGLDPDLTADDGTYSAYILYHCLDNGRVNIKVQASSNGTTYTSTVGLLTSYLDIIPVSDIPDGDNVGAFQRTSLPGELNVINYVETDNDVTPPGRITDLVMQNVASESNGASERINYTLRWRAPGNNMSVGRASTYEFRVSNDNNKILNDFTTGKVVPFWNTSLVPKSAGEYEAVTITVNSRADYTETAFLAIVAVDDAGNRGPVSNVISITVATDYTIEGDVRNVYDDDVDNTNDIPWITVALAVIGLCLLVIVCACVAVYIHCRRKSSSRDNHA